MFLFRKTDYLLSKLGVKVLFTARTQKRPDDGGRFINGAFNATTLNGISDKLFIFEQKGWQLAAGG